jgi:hypothetical protein
LAPKLAPPHIADDQDPAAVVKFEAGHLCAAHFVDAHQHSE